MIFEQADHDNQPIILSDPSVAPNASYDRCPSALDTNNSDFDFVAHLTVAEQTPGQICQGVPGVDLRIAKVGPSVVLPGSKIQYTLAFSNIGSGPDSAISVVVTDTLPLGLTFDSQSSSTPGLVFGGASQDGRSMSWNLASLGPGATGSVTLVVAVDGALGLNTLLTNTAGISSATVELPANRHNNVTSHTTITQGPPDVTVSSTWPTAAKPAPGSEFTYTISYANMGADDASDVTITDSLPADVTLVSASAPDASFNHATSGNLVWSVPALASLDTGTIELRVRVGAKVAPGTALLNQVTISSNPADSPTTNNSEVKVLVVGQYGLFLPIVRK